MQNTSDTVAVAGISVEEISKGNFRYHFHATAKTTDDRRVGVQIALPHTTTFKLTELPRKMTRLKAAEYIEDKKKGFNDPKARKFLKGLIKRSKARLARESRPSRGRGRPPMNGKQRLAA